MKKFILLILVIWLPQVWAIPGADTFQALKQYYVLVEQLKELKKQVDQAKSFIEQGRQAVRDAEGHYGFGKLLNNESDYKKRLWGFDRWDSALKSLSGGNSIRYQELLREYQNKYTPLSISQFSKGASHSVVEGYKNMLEMNKVATASSNYEYENLNPMLNRVNQLMEKIEMAPNTKSAIDLNSRLIAQLSNISIEELRMQTLFNHQMAEKISDELRAKKNSAMFNQLPKEKL